MRQEAGEKPGIEVRSSIPGHYTSCLICIQRGREASDYAAKRNLTLTSGRGAPRPRVHVKVGCPLGLLITNATLACHMSGCSDYGNESEH